VQDFPKEERLLSRHDFLSIPQQGHKVHAPHFIVIYRVTTGTAPRIGITVSRKVGNAVIRNRVKRRIREFYRLHKGLFPAADVNIIARQGAGGLSTVHMWHELAGALRRVS